MALKIEISYGYKRPFDASYQARHVHEYMYVRDDTDWTVQVAREQELERRIRKTFDEWKREMCQNFTAGAAPG